MDNFVTISADSDLDQTVVEVLSDLTVEYDGVSVRPLTLGFAGPRQINMGLDLPLTVPVGIVTLRYVNNSGWFKAADGSAIDSFVITLTPYV